MWISKTEYRRLKDTAEANTQDAEMFRGLCYSIQKKKTVIYKDFVMMSYDVYNEISKNNHSNEDKVKELQAELTWYKVKFHEMRMQENIDNE